VHRHGLLAGAHLELYGVVADQQGELRPQVMGKQVRAGEGGGVAACAGHKAKTQQLAFGVLGRRPVGGRLQTHIGVTGTHPVLHVLTGHKALHGVAQMGHALGINRLHAGEGRIGIVEDFGGDEGNGGSHADIVHKPCEYPDQRLGDRCGTSMCLSASRFTLMTFMDMQTRLGFRAK
jgi:hypothetical protein